MKKCLIGIVYILFFILIQPLCVNAASEDYSISIELADEYETEVDMSNSTSRLIDGINALLYQYRLIVMGIFGVATLTSVLFLIINIGNLGSAGAFSKSETRQKAITKLLLNVLGIAGLGGITIVFGLIYNVFR